MRGVLLWVGPFALNPWQDSVDHDVRDHVNYNYSGDGDHDNNHSRFLRQVSGPVIAKPSPYKPLNLNTPRPETRVQQPKTVQGYGIA